MKDRARAYIACQYCRQRKTKCIIDLSSPLIAGRERQCARCAREGRHCVIIKGARRPAPHRTGDSQFRSQSPNLSFDIQQDNVRSTTVDRQTPSSNRQTSHGPFPDVYGRPPGYRAISNSAPSNEDWSSETGAPEPANLSNGSTDETVVQEQLQNPYDALHLLARVAHGAHNDNEPLSSETEEHSHTLPTHSPSTILEIFDVQIAPLQTAQTLIFIYKQNYHQFFPIANDRVCDPAKLNTSAMEEPHLLLVLLTIASKHEKAFQDAHQACLSALNSRLAEIVCLGSHKLEVVEALLLLAEWTPQKFRSQSNVGSGEEERAAWMQVGTAVRLGYLQGLDAASFDDTENGESQLAKRRRIAWAACFMSDRQISVRLGKAFWSRGPGPSSIRAFDNYQPFEPRAPHFDDFSSIFQAHLDLTLLFSNVHDVLYASTSHRDRLFKSGEYAKYIDDFLAALSHWQEKWGAMACSSCIKSSLILSYEYLRLYVTAFAYQATLSRLSTEVGKKQGPTSVREFLLKQLASTSDARFIYESVNAAKQLLSTFNSFVDPQKCLKYMPMKYYLYVIYAAVFLYKAEATGIMNDANPKALASLIAKTITRLKESSSTDEDIGTRYSNLLERLWKKHSRTGHRSSIAHPPHVSIRTAPSGVVVHEQNPANNNISNLSISIQPEIHALAPDNSAVFGDFAKDFDMHMDLFNSFAWHDLEAAGQFATATNSVFGDDTIRDSSSLHTQDLGDIFPMQFNTTRASMDLW